MLNRTAVNGSTITAATVTANWNANGWRLPTEAEWEYANRAGSTAVWHFGDEASLHGNYAWYLNNSDGMTRQVGRRQPNAWGLYDTHGNVWEWVWDWHVPFPNADLNNPRGPDAGSNRVFRGGSFYVAAAHTRSALRSGVTPDFRYYGSLGFRLVRP